MKNRILVVDDESGIRAVLKAMLARGGFEAAVAASGEEALEALQHDPVDVVITDLSMGRGMTGMELLRRVRIEHGIPVLMIAAFSTVEVALSAMREGAFDFVRKPFRMDDLFAAVRGALRHHEVGGTTVSLSPVAPDLHFGLLVGDSQGMLELRRLIAQIAPLDIPVLITGEDGAGRSLVAQALHGQSRRGAGPWRVIDCAQTNAASLSGSGLRDAMREAGGGTLFLDNIDALSIGVQGRLVDYLRADSVAPSGTHHGRSIEATFRLLSSVRTEVTQHGDRESLRGDLYEQISAMILEIPPLRRRPEDIPLLVQHVLVQAAGRTGVDVPAVRKDALRMLQRYAWPGNVTELRSMVEAAVTRSRGGPISVEHLPPNLACAETGGNLLANGEQQVTASGTHARAYLREKQKTYLQMIKERRPHKGD